MINDAQHGDTPAVASDAVFFSDTPPGHGAIVTAANTAYAKWVAKNASVQAFLDKERKARGQ